MILAPRNDRTCLDALTAQVRARVDPANPDRGLLALARELGSTAALVRWLREQPQRDDTGAATDGPRELACRPSQRIRFQAPDPNCVERALTYLAVAEFLDPAPARWLATTRTPTGLLHTYPVEAGAPVVLDPMVGVRNGTTRGCCQPRNGTARSWRVRVTPALDRALRVAARAVALAGPSMAAPAAGLALASVGIPPTMLGPIEQALRAEGLTLGLATPPAATAAAPTPTASAPAPTPTASAAASAAACLAAPT